MPPRSYPRGPLLNPKPEADESPSWTEGRCEVYRNDVFTDADGVPYRALEFINRGTFSDVFKCQMMCRPPLDVALKVFRSTPSYRGSAIREIRVHELLAGGPPLAGRDHVIEPFSTFEIGDHPCLVLPILTQFVFDHFEDRTSFSRIRSVIRNLLEAIHYVHACGLAHGDIKPDNMMYDQDGSGHIFLVDFGSAIQDFASVGRPIQTSFYRSPEVFLGMPVGPAIDLWSAGCVAAELFLGVPLFAYRNEDDIPFAMIAALGDMPPEIVHHGKNAGKYFAAGKPKEQPRDVCLQKHICKRQLAGRVTLDELVSGDDDETRHFRDFLRGLLSYDADERLSPDAALAHPFLHDQ
jgi:dual specificity protein kinase YAK1